jgi:transposase InsO family protein
MPSAPASPPEAFSRDHARQWPPGCPRSSSISREVGPSAGEQGPRTQLLLGTVRAECLDWLLIKGRGHLEQVLRRYVQHYNQHRPHRALGLQAPDYPLS